MNGALGKALCGPMLLTTVGVLLSLDHLNYWSFGRTWPILLIVLGVCKLLEHMGPRKA